ncbi:MAG: LysR family transcriptional regulator [Clostridia bacterium]|nr:LysR family transcriptional regulator [Clostridia bacterium]
MNLDTYRIFYHVATSGSFTRAAQVLHNSQPNMIRYINILEEELGCRLFIRGRKGVTLTEEGGQLYRKVSEAMQLLSEGERDIKNMQRMSQGYIAIGASETSLRLLLLEQLEAFNALYPSIKINITNSSSPEALRALDSGLVNMAVITSPYTLPGYMNDIPVKTFREILICGPAYKDLAESKLPLKALEQLPVICMRPDSATRTLYQNYFIEHGVKITPDMECETSDQILHMVLHNLGVGFYPEELVRKELKNGKLYRIELEEKEPERTISIITSGRTDPGNAGRKLIELMTVQSSR